MAHFPASQYFEWSAPETGANLTTDHWALMMYSPQSAKVPFFLFTTILEAIQLLCR